MMIDPGVRVYAGMIVGEHDLATTTLRSMYQGQEAHQHPYHLEGRDEAVRLTPPIRMTSERARLVFRTTSWSRRRNPSDCARYRIL